jgi:uncharacterized protein (DUF1778 family)
MTQTRTRRQTRTHRITVRFNRSTRRSIEALADFNRRSVNDQLVAMLWGALGK